MSPYTHTEIETKFDADGDVDVAHLATVDGVVRMGSPVVEELDAEYFDTPDLALLAAGLVLRRWRGGDDAGWHVKIPRSKGERVEIHEPLSASRGQPPRALRDLVTARTRRAPLERVARLRTRRTVYRLLDERGRPVADVADDTVTADIAGQPPRRGERSTLSSPTATATSLPPSNTSSTTKAQRHRRRAPTSPESSPTASPRRHGSRH
jgi:hypothetical protein